MKASILGTGKTMVFFEEPTLLSVLLQRGGVPFDMPCGGRHACKKCRVYAEGALRPASAEEMAALASVDAGPGERMACMAEACGDVRITLPGRTGDAILTAGAMPALVPDGGDGYGIAVDIGTTTLAAYLYRLSDGALLATDCAPNPQTIFGADVITRMQRSLEGACGELAACVRRAIGGMMTEITRKAGVSLAETGRAVLAGNTAMLYCLCARSPRTLTAVPFVPDCLFDEELTPAALELPLPASARVYLARSVSAYVGADITAAMTAVGFDARPKGPCLLADIGTNGEMALWTPEAVYACSTAAGPAFEGAGLYCGMAARAGAIRRVSREGDSLRCEVIGGGPARGLCGSGIVDALAVLLCAGAVDETGRFVPDGHPFADCMTQADGQPAFRLPGTEVLLTQKDVRSIQLAKAALAAGLLALLHAAGLEQEKVETLYLAGGFGNCIDTASAAAIGLLPGELAQKAAPAGNAAGTGASMLLLSDAKRRSSVALAARTQVLELAADPYFMEQYVEQMMFPEKKEG